MALPWKSVFEELPTNNEIVWIRVVNYYGEPVLAKFKKAPEKFVTVLTSIDVPVFNVARWRSQ